jgi:AcrR family transcriptional regulator
MGRRRRGESGIMEQDQDDLPLLRIRARPGAYACGIETIEQILRAALHVLVEEGSRAFTLRRIAAECGMRVGNLSYYFPRKEDLVAELLESILAGYSEMTAELLGDVSDQPVARLERVIALMLDDLRTKRTTHLFPELWALANHDEKVERLVQDFYARAQARLAVTVRAINPALSEADSLTVALLISATIEGTTMFAGYHKPWEPKMPEIKALAVQSLVHLARTVRPADLRAFRRARTRAAA